LTSEILRKDNNHKLSVSLDDGIKRKLGKLVAVELSYAMREYLSLSRPLCFSFVHYQIDRLGHPVRGGGGVNRQARLGVIMVECLNWIIEQLPLTSMNEGNLLVPKAVSVHILC
jgi:hypothetical protein